MILRLSAILLIAIAVAAFTPPLSGLGRPSPEEILARVAIGEAPGLVSGARTGALRFLPWDDNGLLLLGAAMAVTAGLLLGLGRRVHRHGREPLAPRWRTSLTLWGVALTLVSIPSAIFLFSPAIATTTIEMVSMSGYCPSFAADLALGQVTAVLAPLPDPLVVGAAFGAWVLLARTGHPVWGRTVGWLAVVPLVIWDARRLVLPAVDAVLGQDCSISSSEEFDPLAFAWSLHSLLTAALIIWAVRVRRTPRTYPSRGGHAAAVLGVVVLLATVPSMDAPLGKITPAASPVCKSWEMARYMPVPTPPEDRETAFLCVARQSGELARRLADVPDVHAVAFGRRMCAAYLRGERGAAIGDDEAQTAMKVLCPEVERREDADAEQAEVENRAFIAEARGRCRSLPRHRPRIRAARVERATMFVSFGSLNAYEDDRGDDFASLNASVRNGLVGTAPGQLTILPADEVGHVCVTAEVYRRRPPVERKGWEKVVETGYRSTRGDLRLVDDSGNATGNLAIDRAGSYRIRVHMRGAEAAMGQDGDARQEFLVMVFPGTSGRTTVLK